MTEALDFFYSSSVWMIVIIIVVMFLCIGFSFVSPFKNKKLNYVYKIFLNAFGFCFMMSFQFLYYGYADEFKKMCIGKTTICLMEEYERGGEGPSENVCRLHIMNKATGIRKERYYVGSSGQLVGMRNDTLCYFRNYDVVLLDAANLKEIYRIKKDEWGKISPELSVGMESIYSDHDRSNSGSFFVELNCKNAKKYWFDPFSKKLTDQEPNDNYKPWFSDNTYELTVKYAANKQVNYLKDDYAGSNNLKRIVPGYNARNLFTVKDSSTYIDPFFLCIDTVKKVFVFGHYTTTDRKDYCLEAKDFEFTTKWKKTGSGIATDDYNEPKVNVWQYTNNMLYFNNGGFIVAMNPALGKIIWVSRL
ncbi:MAG: hypothetical protein H0U95_04040 [Bacteroidetes bacterium]|nr:hypothetical protein [Bacteroidota bacterium]